MLRNNVAETDTCFVTNSFIPICCRKIYRRGMANVNTDAKFNVLPPPVANVTQSSPVCSTWMREADVTKLALAAASKCRFTARIIELLIKFCLNMFSKW